MGVPVDTGEATLRTFCVTSLQRVFNDSFAASHATRLVGGASEPLYQPAHGAQQWHRLYFREDYFASALHEVAHWCIAGEARRRLVDFGYWYAPEGRSPAQQRAFEAVECKPQALEWFFSRACGYRFRVSVDNLDAVEGAIPDTLPFRRQLLSQARRWQQQGLPPRADRFYRALCREFGSDLQPSQQIFELADLDP